MAPPSSQLVGEALVAADIVLAWQEGRTKAIDAQVHHDPACALRKQLDDAGTTTCTCAAVSDAELVVRTVNAAMAEYLRQNPRARGPDDPGAYGGVMRIVILFLLVACGDNHQLAHLLDAYESPPDAPYVYDAGLGCCVHYPDAAAIAACAAPTFPACTCGVIACQRPASDGGGFLKINACGPSPDGGSCLPPTDAGVDAP
jgi:hypothetical protein